jgi:RimJ/RimL family protein N-acetyltransferase
MDDIETVFEYSSDLENTYYMLTPPDASKDETKAFVKKCISEYDRPHPRYLSFAVTLDGLHIGEVFAEVKGKEADIGWVINKKYWGHGYATQAAKLLIEYLKESLGVTELVAFCDARNVSSQKVMEHLGMTLIGTNGIRKYDKDVPDGEELRFSAKLS